MASASFSAASRRLRDSGPRLRPPPPRAPRRSASSSATRSAALASARELARQARPVREEVGRRGPVLAQELLEPEEPLLDLGEALGVRLDAIRVPREGPRRVRRAPPGPTRRRARARPGTRRCAAAWSSSVPQPRQLVADGPLPLVEPLRRPPRRAWSFSACRRRARSCSSSVSSPSRGSSSSISRSWNRRKSSRSARPRSWALAASSSRTTSTSPSTCSATFARSASSLPKASRYSRWVAGSVRLTLSCCDAMSHRSGAISASCVAVQSRPLTYARLRPSAWMTRRTTSSRSLGTPAASSFAAAREPGASSKSASTSASRPPLARGPASPGRPGRATGRPPPSTCLPPSHR